MITTETQNQVMKFTTRRDAEDYVEECLGSEGTRALAVIFCTLTRWQTVDQLTEQEWAELLDKAERKTR